MTDPMTTEQRAAILAQLGGAQPATDGLLASFGKSVADMLSHDHTSQREDWYCTNLAAYMGERSAPVLRRLLDAESRAARYRTAWIERDAAAEVLSLATVLEIPRPGTGIPLQLRRSHGHADRWAICDRTGRRWYPEGWMFEPDDDRLCDKGRFTLAEAVPLARRIAGGGEGQ